MNSLTPKGHSPSDTLRTSATGPTTLIALIILLLGAAGCNRASRSGASQHSPGTGETQSLTTLRSIDPLALVLAPHTGHGRVDSEIRRFQERVRTESNSNAAVERLGWLYVAKARESFDPGFYTLAEACARVLEARAAGCPQPRLGAPASRRHKTATDTLQETGWRDARVPRNEALLLRGHVLQNLHRFKETEPLARELVAQRGLSFDYALLGDTLMEQGKLAEAAGAYQSMMDLRPDLHSYLRAAHLRWLKGDLTGALELMQLAASASSPLDPESAAWVHTRLAFYQLLTGAQSEADRACDRALQFQTNYPPALLLRGRILLAQGNGAEAIEVLQIATKRNPLPEYQWVWAEALRQAGRLTEAGEVEAQLERNGATNDPRTYSLYLATRGQSLATALRLAEKELEERSDVFTHDARAWSLAAAGRLQEAQGEMEKALAEGTEDARLFFHAAVIAARSGMQQDALHWFKKANQHIQILLPSEQRQLLDAALAASMASRPESTPQPASAGVGFFTRGN